MKIYSSIPSVYQSKDLINRSIIAFDKIDGSNIRVEGSIKTGFDKFGCRRHLIDRNTEMLGVAVNLFKEKEEKILEILSKNKLQGHELTLYFELFGKNSFAGKHEIEDKKDIYLIDVWIKKLGFIEPKEFIDLFSEVGIPKIIYSGILDQEFIDWVINNEEINEGVVCKSTRKMKDGNIRMCKIKTGRWIEKVKSKFENYADLI